jgi:hypothetical protein
MTRASALDFFDVVRAFALALAAVGLLLVAATLVASMSMSLPLTMLPPALLPGAFGVSALLAGLVLVATPRRFRVARMTFRS